MHGTFAKSLVACLLVLTLGLHWMVLQSVAWLGMFVSYSQKAPLHVALQKTFDGKNPCTLCKFVADGKKAESEQGSSQVTVKLDLFLVRNTPVLFPPDFQPTLPPYLPAKTGLSGAPPSPPPKTA